MQQPPKIGSPTHHESSSQNLKASPFLDRVKLWEGITDVVVNSPVIRYDHKILLLILALMTVGNVGICAFGGTFSINLLLTITLGIFGAFFIKSRENQDSNP